MLQNPTTFFMLCTTVVKMFFYVTKHLGSSSEAGLNVFVRSRSNWNLEVLVCEERGKPEHPGKNLSEQGREPTTNSTHI